MTATGLRTVSVGERSYPLVLPRLSDSRLHLAAVIISIHILGQLTLGFRVSVPQILIAIGVAAVTELVWTFFRSKAIVWPASAMLTGSGIGLILRVVGTERGDHWTFRGWYFFALVSVGALASKYLITWRGAHIFNPSNFALVVAFLVLGSHVVEPLDFWWATLGPGMGAAYLIIGLGGVLINRRLALLPMAAAFWATFAVGLGAVVSRGHCLTTAWSLSPVCGRDLWWVVATSPELLIFLFFMITDPKTIPSRSVARVWFAVCVAVLSTIFIAPQSTEFGAKVGLLAGLVLLSPLRWALDAVAARMAPDDRFRTVLSRLLAAPRSGRAGVFGRGVVAGSVVVALLAAVVLIAGPRQTLPARAAAGTPPDVGPIVLPPVDVSLDAAGIRPSPGASPVDIAAGLVGALAVEARAVRNADVGLLRSADSGPRLVTMQDAARGESRTAHVYHIESLYLRLVEVNGPQGGVNLAFDAVGSVDSVDYDIAGAETGRTTEPFATTFVMLRSESGAWLILDSSAT